MSILEILEAHHEWDVDIDYDGSQDAVTCPCGWRELLGLHAGAQHRAHVAQVLEQHEREVMAAAYESAAERLHEEAASQQDMNRRNGRSEFLHAAVRMTVMEHEMRRSSAQFRATS